MLTDEQLAERLRAALVQETARLEPPPRLLDAIHAQLAVSPPAHTWRRWRPALAAGAGVAVTVAVAATVFVLAAHRAPSSSRTAGSRPAISHVTQPAPQSANPVAAPVQLTVGRIGHYCNAAGGDVVPCPTGAGVVPYQPQRLVTIAVLAHRGTDSRHWYAWSFTAPVGCPNASAGGPTHSAVRAGGRLTFQALLPAGCRGRARATVVYVTASARSDSEHIDAVGRAAVTVP